MTTIAIFSIIILAALIHSSFQLSISTFTLMSGHHLGKSKSHNTLNNLMGGFLLGVLSMTVLLLSFASIFLIYLSQNISTTLLWSISCGLCFGVGVAVFMFYYPRSAKGTTLWLPRKTAEYLVDRSTNTKNSGEAFGLGLMSVFGESVFLSAPLIMTGLVLIPTSPSMQLLGIVIYTLVSMSSLVLVVALVGSGHKISRIQMWRERNKVFLQFAAGFALFALGLLMYIDQVYPFVMVKV